MTEDEARAWVAERASHAVPVLDRLLDRLREEATRQNLVSAATLPQLWSRHVADSAQLVPLSASPGERWLDIGTGAGFPGLVIAAVTGAPVVCVEPRARRAEWLARVADELGLDGVDVRHSSLANTAPFQAATIVARAVAPLPRLFAMGLPFSDDATRWLLPKGASAQDEVDDAAREWQGVFHVKQSLTDPAAGIVVATDVRRRGARRRP